MKRRLLASVAIKTMNDPKQLIVDQLLKAMELLRMGYVVAAYELIEEIVLELGSEKN